MDHSIDLKKKYKEKKKEWTEAIKKIEILYKCITTNISAIWQHNAQPLINLLLLAARQESYKKPNS